MVIYIPTMEERTDKLRKLGWYTLFAWLPKTIDNHFVWLSFYEERIIGWDCDYLGNLYFEKQTRIKDGIKH